MLLTVAAAAGACARPGDTPAGTPSDTTVSAVPGTPEFGPVPAPATQVSRRPGEAGCARVPEPIEKPIPSGSGVHPGRVDPDPADAGRVDPDPADPGRVGHPRGAGPNDAGPASTADAEERRRRVLRSQHSPVPRRGDVPAAAVPAAERCIRLLQQEFSLRTAGSGTAPGEEAVRATLTGAGLAGVTVRPGPSFAASTGEVCILGTFTGETPAFTIGALAADRSCPL